VKQSLAAVRMLFDWLVTGQVVPVNPAHSVRGPKHVVAKGKTPVLAEDEARQLLATIDTSSLVGLRDRALMATMLYTFARVEAAVGMNVDDYFVQGRRSWLRLQEKGGKQHEMPAHHKLEEFLDAYIESAGGRNAFPPEPGSESPRHRPLFRTAAGKTRLLTANRLTRKDAWRMVRRRAAAAGIATRIGCHSFRATGITNYLENGGTLEKAQIMAAHSSARTTKLYDRRDDRVTLDEIERIAI
jgi:site-specific recombinase XerD